MKILNIISILVVYTVHDFISLGKFEAADQLISCKSTETTYLKNG